MNCLYGSSSQDMKEERLGDDGQKAQESVMRCTIGGGPIEGDCDRVAEGEWMRRTREEGSCSSIRTRSVPRGQMTDDGGSSLPV